MPVSRLFLSSYDSRHQFVAPCRVVPQQGHVTGVVAAAGKLPCTWMTTNVPPIVGLPEKGTRSTSSKYLQTPSSCRYASSNQSHISSCVHPTSNIQGGVGRCLIFDTPNSYGLGDYIIVLTAACSETG